MTMSDADLAEYDELQNLSVTLQAALNQIRIRMDKLSPSPDQPDYRIALRPDVNGEDPFDINTLCDDIVVGAVEMFRAEQMDRNYWWACCYFPDGHERICWSIRARSNPLRIEWVTTEFPTTVTYEHEVSST